MTGIELVKAELQSRGFNISKINANMPLIEAVITILSDEDIRKQINLAEEKLIEAKRESEIATQERRKAQDVNFNTKVYEDKIKNNKEYIERKEKELLELRQEVDKILEAETAEARDKMRMLMMFNSHLPKDIEKNKNAVIYSMGAILGNGMTFEGSKVND